MSINISFRETGFEVRESNKIISWGPMWFLYFLFVEYRPEVTYYVLLLEISVSAEIKNKN
jgi:hypothetical protein